MKRYEDMMIRFYSHVSGIEIDKIEEIPAGAMKIFNAMSYLDLCKPFIVIDLQQGAGQRRVVQRYKVKRSQVRSIGKEFRLCK